MRVATIGSRVRSCVSIHSAPSAMATFSWASFKATFAASRRHSRPRASLSPAVPKA